MDHDMDYTPQASPAASDCHQSTSSSITASPEEEQLMRRNPSRSSALHISTGSMDTMPYNPHLQHYPVNNHHYFVPTNNGNRSHPQMMQAQAHYPNPNPDACHFGVVENQQQQQPHQRIPQQIAQLDPSTPHKLQPPPKFTPNQKVQHWNQHNSQFDSGVQSMSQSSATSLMSSIHAASQISAVSSLPDDYGNYQELTEQQMARFQNIPSSFHPADRENVRRALPELIPLLTDSEEEVVCKALDIVQKIAKFDSDNLYCSDPLIRDKLVIDGLLHALKAHRSNKKVTRLALCTLFHISSNRHGLDLIILSIEEKGTKCLDDLLHCISVKEHSCFKVGELLKEIIRKGMKIIRSVLFQHNLVSEPKIAKQVIHHVRQQKTLTQIVGWLGEKNEKLMTIIVDIIQLLVEKSSEQKLTFLSLNGPNRLIKILQSAQYENLLSRSTKLLKLIAICDPKKIVDDGALEVLHIHLDHSSQRLVRDLLVCIRDLSDVSTKERDVTQLLGKLLQLLGTNDLHIKQLCTQILANLSANNSVNKGFLVENGLVQSIFHVLFETEAYLESIRSRQAVNLNGKLLEDIQDNALAILRSVCTGHELMVQAQHEIMLKRPNDILLQKLVQKRVVLLRKTLRILAVTVTQDSLLPRFREVFKRHPGNSFVVLPYVHEIVQSFHIAAGQLPMTPVIEDVSVGELIQICSNILQSLCRDNFLLENIYETLKEFPAELHNGQKILLPQLILRDEQLAHRAIGLMSQLARIPEAAHMFSQDAITLDILHNWARTKTQIASSAAQTLEWIERGGDQGIKKIGLYLEQEATHSGYAPTHSQYTPQNYQPNQEYASNHQQSVTPQPSYNPDLKNAVTYPNQQYPLVPASNTQLLHQSDLHGQRHPSPYNNTVQSQIPSLIQCPDKDYGPCQEMNECNLHVIGNMEWRHQQQDPVQHGQYNNSIHKREHTQHSHHQEWPSNAAMAAPSERLGKQPNPDKFQGMADYEDYSFANVFCSPTTDRRQSPPFSDSIEAVPSSEQMNDEIRIPKL